MCEWDGVGACAELWFWVQQEKRTDDSKETEEEEEEEGVRVSIELYSLKREKNRQRGRKRNFLVDGQLVTDPFSPQLGCQLSLGQYNISHYCAT